MFGKLIKVSLSLLFILILIPSSNSAQSESISKNTDFTSSTNMADEAFLSARKAFNKKNLKELNRQALQTQSHPLYGYTQLWQLLLQLSEAPNDTIATQALQGFILKNDDSYLAERAKGELVRLAATTDNHELFQTVWPQLVWQNSEPDIRCHKAYMDFSSVPSKKHLSNAISELTTTTTPTSDACKRLGLRIIKEEPNWTWSYLLVLTQQRRFNHVKRILSSIPSKAKLQFSTSAAMDLFVNPESWYRKYRTQTKKLPARLLVLAALILAALDEDKAADIAQRVSPRLNKPTQTLMWGNIGFHAALNHNTKTLHYYHRAPLTLDAHPATVNAALLLQWQIRSALRVQSWTQVLTLINRLPKNLASDPCWVYWKARALIATKKHKQAHVLLKTISNDPNFYGLLACDTLNIPYPKGLAKPPSSLTQESINQIENNPHIRRALAFYDLDLIYEGNREWNWALRKMDSTKRLQLSLYALEKKIFHRAINTSLTTKQLIPELNYPLAYEKYIRSLANKTNLPSEWIFGLIRQESRFIATAKSSAGALGLMQVMPKTASWTAKQYALSDYKRGQLLRPETNLLIGTHYLKTLADNFDSSILLATASYNAGPSRAQLWQSKLLRSTEGAVFAETIPFNETREYVKQVTANMTHYTDQGNQSCRLTQLLGTVTPHTIEDSRIP